jgi:release factor glutamine methyltransferase
MRSVPAGPPAPSRAGIVDRLRAAGCVFAEDEAALLVEAAGTLGELESLVERRVEGLPIEHLLGWAAFCGQRIPVDPGVFVPRLRTEFLVRRAAEVTRPGAVVIDLCCGSGAVSVALCAAVPGIEVHACDVDEAAARCARRNLEPLDGRAYAGDLFEPLPARLRGRVDVLVVNPPYVPTEAIALMPPEARDHEARVALDGGADGLDILRRVVAEAPRWLRPTGHLLTELGAGQVPDAVHAVHAAGMLARVERCEDVGGTVLVATVPPAPRP